MTTKVVNLYKESYDVYGGRGYNNHHMLNTPIGEKGWLGNPYSVEEYGRDECIKLFEGDFLERVMEDEEFYNAVIKLKDLTLGCFCRPRKCHLDIVAGFIDNINHGE